MEGMTMHPWHDDVFTFPPAPAPRRPDLVIRATDLAKPIEQFTVEELQALIALEQEGQRLALEGKL